jgi:hypothetical protein
MYLVLPDQTADDLMDLDLKDGLHLPNRSLPDLEPLGGVFRLATVSI